MHIPKLYREEDRETILAFLRQNNFPALVTIDGNRPVATHLPVEIEADDDGQLTVYGHMSRANPHWQTFGPHEVLLIFQGAHTYISPRWYTHTNVPTWNYQIVHVYGRVRLIEGEALHGLLSRLVAHHEAASTYRLEGLPADFVQREIRGVVGFAIEVTRLDAGYKLSQNRNDEDHARIIDHLEQRSDEFSSEIAEAMRAQRTSPRSR